MTLYTVYKITNILDNKSYIGKHKCNCNPCMYMGSGKYLKRAIKQHGIENFTKEVLFVFESEQEMNAKEAEIVNEEFVVRDDTYNLCFGGNGGFSYINANRLNVTEKQKQAAVKSISVNRLHRKPSTGNPNFVRDVKAKYPNGTWKGRFHSEESKEKNSKTNSIRVRNTINTQQDTIWITDGITNTKMLKGDLIPNGWYAGRVLAKSRGSNNSQFGSMWITNGVESKKISQSEQIPEGWNKGRKRRII